MRIYVIIFILLASACSGTKVYHFESRHYLHLKLTLSKSGQKFEIANSSKELQPFGFLITGSWKRLSDTSLQLLADTNAYYKPFFDNSRVAVPSAAFDWEIYKLYGNSYLFPFFVIDTVYELENRKKIQLDKIIFEKGLKK